MITINRNQELRDLGWRMLLQVRQRSQCADAATWTSKCSQQRAWAAEHTELKT